MNRSIRKLVKNAQKLQVNPDNLNWVDLKNSTYGTKSMPLLTRSKRLYDTLHTKLSFGKSNHKYTLIQ